MDKLLKKMEFYASVHKVPIINDQGRRVLMDVVKQKRPRRVLEIGTAIGYSTLLIAAGSAEGAEITTLELDDQRAQVAADFVAESAYRDCIEIVVGDAGKLLPSMTGTFDLVFIDAAKGQYPDYFQKVLPMIDEGGVIIADNVLFRGYVLGEETPPRRYKTIVSRLKHYIEIVTHHPEFVTEIYQNGDGLAVSRHRGKKLEKT